MGYHLWCPNVNGNEFNNESRVNCKLRGFFRTYFLQSQTALLVCTLIRKPYTMNNSHSVCTGLAHNPVTCVFEYLSSD